VISLARAFIYAGCPVLSTACGKLMKIYFSNSEAISYLPGKRIYKIKGVATGETGLY